MSQSINTANQTTKLKLFAVYNETIQKSAHDTASLQIDTDFGFIPWVTGTAKFLGNTYNHTATIISGNPPIIHMISSIYSAQAYVFYALSFPDNTSDYAAQEFPIEFTINVYQEVAI